MLFYSLLLRLLSFFLFVFFFFNDTATTEIYTLSLHDALPISGGFIYNPTTSVSFSRNFASRDSLKVRLRCGLILCSCHKRFTVFLLTPCASAMSRQLQWVIPLGLLCKVALMIRSRCSCV